MPKLVQGSNHTYSMSDMDCTGIYYSGSEMECFINIVDSVPASRVAGTVVYHIIVVERFHGRKILPQAHPQY